MTYNEVFEQGGYFDPSIERTSHSNAIGERLKTLRIVASEQQGNARINLGDIHMGWNLLLDITETNDHESHVTMVRWELLEYAE